MDASTEQQATRYEALVEQVAKECYGTLTYEEIGRIRSRPRPIIYHLTLGQIIRSAYSERFERECIPYRRDAMSIDVIRAMLPYVLPEYRKFPLCYLLFDWESFCDLNTYYQLGLYPQFFARIAEHYHYMKDIDTKVSSNPYDYETDQEQWLNYMEDAETGLSGFMTALAKGLWNFPAVKVKATEYGIAPEVVDEFEQYCMHTMLNGKWYGGRVMPSKLVLFHSERPLAGDDLDDFIRPLIWFLKNAPGNDDILRDVLFENRDFCLLLATHAGRLLRRMPSFQDDDAIVAAAVAQYPDAISYASPRLQKDSAILVMAARNARETLILRNPTMKPYRDNKALVAMAVAANGANIAYASKEIRSMRSFAEIALRNLTDFAPYIAYESLSDSLKEDKDIALLAVRSGHVDIDAFPESLRDDDDVARLLVENKQSRWQLSRMSNRIRKEYGEVLDSALSQAD